MALPLIPLNHTDDAWLLITGDAPAPDHPDHENIVRLEDYVVATWLEVDSPFHRELWNHYGEDDDRTTNAAESFHHRLNSVCGKHRLNIHAYCIKLMRELRNAEVRIAQLEMGGPLPKKKAVHQILRQRIARYRQEFEAGDRNFQRFLDATSYQLHDNLV